MTNPFLIIPDQRLQKLRKIGALSVHIAVCSSCCLKFYEKGNYFLYNNKNFQKISDLQGNSAPFTLLALQEQIWLQFRNGSTQTFFEIWFYSNN